MERIVPSSLVQPRKVTPETGVATRAAPARAISVVVPSTIAVPSTVTEPRAASKSKVTLEDALAATSAKLLITSLLTVEFFAVVMVAVKLVPASITLEKLPAEPVYVAPSITS